MSKPPLKSFVPKQSKSNQNKLIFKALIKTNQPITRRTLSEITGLENKIICRALSNLVSNRKLLKVVCIKPCEKTKRKVNHYHFIDGLKLGGLKQ